MLSVGTDMVSLPRIEKVYAKHPVRFAKRILHPTEFTCFTQLPTHKQPLWLAKRFAVKEATAKALGTGFQDGVSFNQIILNKDAKGAPYLTLVDDALAVKTAKGIQALSVSLSDELPYVLAFVVGMTV